MPEVPGTGTFVLERVTGLRAAGFGDLALERTAARVADIYAAVTRGSQRT